MEIDLKDRKILHALSLNARAPITEIAKNVKMSKQLVSYKIRKLEEKEVIEGYYAVTNIYLLGKTSFRVFVKYKNMDSDTENKLIQYTKEEENITWLAIFDGELDAGIVFWMNHPLEFHKAYKKLNEKFGKYFAEKYFSIAAKIEYYKYNFLTKETTGEKLVFGGISNSLEIDDLDKDIIETLNKNARTTLLDMAIKHKKSAKVIRDRIKNLEDKKIILGYNIKVNHNKLGFTHRKVFLQLANTAPENIEKIRGYLTQQHQLIYIVEPIGSFDMEFEVMTETNEEFHNFVRNLRNKFLEEIREYNSVIHYKEPISGQITKL